AAPFQKQLDRLARKFPQVIEVVASLVDALQADQRPGDKIPGIGYDVYKLRLRNPSARRGKSGGFRGVYYVRVSNHGVLLTIYSKTRQTDIHVEDIRRILQELEPPKES